MQAKLQMHSPRPAKLAPHYHFKYIEQLGWRSVLQREESWRRTWTRRALRRKGGVDEAAAAAVEAVERLRPRMRPSPRNHNT